MFPPVGPEARGVGGSERPEEQAGGLPPKSVPTDDRYCGAHRNIYPQPGDRPPSCPPQAAEPGSDPSLFQAKIAGKLIENQKIRTKSALQRSTTPLAEGGKVRKTAFNMKKGNLSPRKGSLGSHLVAIQHFPFFQALRPQRFPAVFGSHLVAML